jgi:hypothetical protein
MIYAESLCVDLERQIKEKQMGRPLRKDILGTDVIGTFTSDAGVRVDYHDGSSLVTTGIIKKQRGAKTFVVLSAFNDTFVDGESIKGPTSTFFRTGTLVATTPDAEGELLMLGTLNNGSAEVAIAKITKRVATDFSGNRYTWVMSQYNDSTGDQILLTAI